MKTEVEIRQAGMNALLQTLGTLEAERFVAALTRVRFDYTEWRKTGLPDWDIERLSAQAAFSENFGLVIAEALAVGVPVITTKATRNKNPPVISLDQALAPDEDLATEGHGRHGKRKNSVLFRVVPWLGLE